jgi:hypothetical protein
MLIYFVSVGGEHSSSLALKRRENAGRREPSPSVGLGSKKTVKRDFFQSFFEKSLFLVIFSIILLFETVLLN